MPISKSEFSYTLDLGEEFNELDPDEKKNAKQEIGIAILEEMFDYLDSGVTPVSGGRYKKTLSKNYKKRKIAMGGQGIADLDLTSDMISSLRFSKAKTGNDIKISINKAKEILKAYNHNVGDTLPQREFMPKEGGKFKPKIRQRVDSIIADYLDD